MFNFKKFFNYGSYVFRHKYFVAIECFKRGLYWRGLIHDWHKFLPDEFIPYMNHFGAGIKTGRDKTGYYKPYDTADPAFDRAWFKHSKRGTHHWQWHCMPLDTEGMKVFDMPMEDRIEMLCDWFGAGRAQGTPDTKKWYATNKEKLQLHQNTRDWIEEQLGFDVKAIKENKISDEEITQALREGTKAREAVEKEFRAKPLRPEVRYIRDSDLGKGKRE